MWLAKNIRRSSLHHDGSGLLLRSYLYGPRKDVRLSITSPPLLPPPLHYLCPMNLLPRDYLIHRTNITAVPSGPSKNSISTFAPGLSRFRPSLLYWLFLSCDLVSLLLQGVGGGPLGHVLGPAPAGPPHRARRARPAGRHAGRLLHRLRRPGLARARRFGLLLPLAAHTAVTTTPQESRGPGRGRPSCWPSP